MRIDGRQEGNRRREPGQKDQASSRYMALYFRLRKEITEGVYRYGEKLPSKRMLSESSGCSVITVEHSYGLLQEEGYIEARERSGYFVCYRESDLISASPGAGGTGTGRVGADVAGSAGADWAGRGSGGNAGNAGAYGGESGQETSEEEEPERIVQQGEEAGESLSFSSLARAMRKVLSDRGEQILRRSPNEGIPELREAIASYLGRSRGIHTDSRRILIGAGSEYMYSLVVQMLGRDRVYGLEDPSYERIRKVYEANGAVTELLALGKQGIRTEALRRTGASVLHVTPFNSYPSGITATASKRHEYIRWAGERGGVIIEDDFDSEFSMSTKAEDTLFSLEPQRSVIYMNTFTRTIGPSVRMGYMVLPEDSAQELMKKISSYSCTVPVFEQYVLTELLESGGFERHINRVRRKRRLLRKNWQERQQDSILKE